MASHRETISLHDPDHNRAIQIITAATAAATRATSGDPQPAVRALALVLSHYRDADRGLATNKAIRERGEEVGKDFAGLVRWMRGVRGQPTSRCCTPSCARWLGVDPMPDHLTWIVSDTGLFEMLRMRSKCHALPNFDHPAHPRLDRRLADVGL